MPREGGGTATMGRSTPRVQTREKRRKETGAGGGGERGIGGAHRRDYRAKLRTKVIRPWRPGRVFGITGGLYMWLLLFFFVAK